VRRLAARIGGICRHSGKNNPELPELRRRLKVAQAAWHLRELLAAPPHFTTDDRIYLAGILHPGEAKNDEVAA
jgi:hypothetical protein